MRRGRRGGREKERRKVGRAEWEGGIDNYRQLRLTFFTKVMRSFPTNAAENSGLLGSSKWRMTLTTYCRPLRPDESTLGGKRERDVREQQTQVCDS